MTGMTGGVPIRLEGDDLQQCIHCGMCLEACPTYRITGLETESPRGRIHLMGALAAGRIAPTPVATIHLDRCLACRACEAVCPSGVPYGRLIETTRAELAARSTGGPARSAHLGRWLLRLVASEPRRLVRLTRILSIYEWTGLRALIRRSGALRLLPERARRLEALLPPLRRPAYRAPAIVATPRARVALLQGCVMRASYGDVHTAAGRLLAHAGVAVVDVADQGCCGALHAHAGDRPEARRLARRAIAAFEAASVDAVIVDAAGCGAHLKGYGELLADDLEWSERARAFAATVRDVTEYLDAMLPPAPLGPLALRVTYQDPCHLAHAQRITAPPRALLGRVNGLTLAEMRGADVCCGSAGTYNITQPDYADRLLRDKVDAVLATAPDVVVTANPGCMLQLEAGLRARGVRVPVLHVVEVLARALDAR